MARIKQCRGGRLDSRRAAASCLRAGRHWIEGAAVGTLAWSLPRLPRGAALAFAWLLGGVAARVDRRGRATALENLELAMANGGLDLGGRSPGRLVTACYRNFARACVDLFWFQRLAPEQLGRWFEIEGWERLERVLADGRGAIYVTPHFGLFELSTIVVALRGLSLNIVAQDFKNAALTDLFRRARAAGGHRVVSRNGATLRLFKALRHGRHVAMLPDLAVRPQGAATVVRCFGLPACVSGLHVELARRCQAPLVVAVCEPLRRGRARLKILGVYDPPVPEEAQPAVRAGVAQKVWDRFETEVRRRPEQWMWMYRQWRYAPDEAVSGVGPRAMQDASEPPPPRYPSYARRCTMFARLQRRLRGG